MHGVVWQDPLAHFLMIEGGRRLNWRDVAARRFWIRVGVEGRLGDGRSNAARPPSGADALVRIRLDHHPVRAVRNSPRVRRRRPARESSTREVEAAPPEMRGTALPSKATTKPLQHAI